MPVPRATRPAADGADGPLGRPAGLSTRSRRLVVAFVVVAVGLRVYPWFLPHVFLGVMENDDAIHYASAQMLLHGRLPYRDFLFLQPPGIAVLLLPFAGLGELFGHPVGLAAGRVAMIGVTLLNLRLVADLAGRGLRAGAREVSVVTAVALYAVMPDAVVAEHTVMLEPLTTLFGLSAVTFLLRHTHVSRRSALGAGALLAVGTGTKLFGAAYLVVIVGWLLLRRDLAAFRRLAGGFATVLAVMALPFVVPDPGAAWHQVVATQLARPPTGAITGLERLASMTGLSAIPPPLAVVVLVLLLAIAGACVAKTSDEVLLLSLALVLVSALALGRAASYYPHYGAFLAAPLAVLAGRSVGLGLAHARTPGRPRLAAAVACVLALSFTGSSIQEGRTWHAQGDSRLAGALVPAGSCVYYQTTFLAVAADLFTVPTRSCPGLIDASGVVLSDQSPWTTGQPYVPNAYLQDAPWQSQLRRSIDAADFLALPTVPSGIREWSPSTRARAEQDFRPVWEMRTPGLSWQLWQRRR